MSDRPVFSVRIRTKKDMAELEDTITTLLGGEQGKCALIRSQDFLALRLRALYGRESGRPLVVYGEGLKIALDLDNVGSVSLLNPPPIDPVDEAYEAYMLGKRPRPEDEAPP
jgi:hypothetical protein